MQDVLERTDGALRLSPSSLYAAIRRLLEQALIEELAERPDPAQDENAAGITASRAWSRGGDGRGAPARASAADARATGLLPRRS